MKLLFVNGTLTGPGYSIPVHHITEPGRVFSAFPRWLLITNFYTNYVRSRSWFSPIIQDKVLVAQEVEFQYFSGAELNLFRPLMEDALRRQDFTLVQAALLLITPPMEASQHEQP